MHNKRTQQPPCFRHPGFIEPRFIEDGFGKKTMGASFHVFALQLNVAYLDAILGAQYEVDTIRGTAWLTIPPGTQHGQSLKLQGAGVQASSVQGEMEQPATTLADGSHYFEVAVKVPIDLDSAEKDLLQQLRSLVTA